MLRVVVRFGNAAIDIGVERRDHPRPRTRACKNVEEGKRPVLPSGEAGIGSDPIVVRRPRGVLAPRLHILHVQEAAA